MAGYTVYFLTDGRSVPDFDFTECENDDGALQEAQRLLLGHLTARLAEVSNGQRVIGVVERAGTGDVKAIAPVKVMQTFALSKNGDGPTTSSTGTMKSAIPGKNNRSRSMADEEITNDATMRLVSDIVAAYVSNAKLKPDELPALIRQVHTSLTLLGQDEPPQATTQVPAVPVKKSITTDFLICLEDGAQMKTLKRYLRTRFNLTPEEYRRRWGLPADYPMVAPAYSERRSTLAKAAGLGQAVRRPKAIPAPPPAPAPADAPAAAPAKRRWFRKPV